MKRIVVSGLAALAAVAVVGSAPAQEPAQEQAGGGTGKIAERVAGALAPRLGGAGAAGGGIRALTLAAPSDEDHAARQQALAERVRRALAAPVEEAGDARR